MQIKITNIITKKILTNEQIFYIINKNKCSQQVFGYLEVSVMEIRIGNLWNQLIHFRYAVIISIFLLTAVTAVVLAGRSTAGADDGIRREKRIISIQVKEGDTLWSIACDFYTEEYGNVKKLIKEIKKTNRISDQIYIGQKLLIPHYVPCDEEIYSIKYNL